MHGKGFTAAGAVVPLPRRSTLKNFFGAGAGMAVLLYGIAVMENDLDVDPRTWDPDILAGIGGLWLLVMGICVVLAVRADRSSAAPEDPEEIEDQPWP